MFPYLHQIASRSPLGCTVIRSISPKFALTSAAFAAAFVIGCGGGTTSNPPGGGMQNVAPSFTMQPADQTVTVGSMATFTVVAAGTPAPTLQWQKNGTNIANATSASFTTPATVAGDNGATFDVVATNAVGTATSATAKLTVNAAPPSSSSNRDVVTYHYDNLRTGQNTQEQTLTTANVTSAKFGKLGSFTVDGLVDAQPLYLASLAIPGVGAKNVLYVVTEHDSVYAFDADSINGATATFLWKVSALGTGEVPSDNRGCGQVTPEIGITSTPVIDRTRNAIYLIAMSKDASGNYIHRLHALNLMTGAEMFGGPTTISASFTGSGATVSFDPKQYKERPGLLQVNGTIYTTWGSHCDFVPYTSWIMSYSADTLKQASVLNLDPNGTTGREGGIWMAGGAPGADASGNIYFIVGNGSFDTTLDANGMPSKGDCGNCFAKITSTAPLKLLDYFTPFNTVMESDADIDFGSGAELLLPDIMDNAGGMHHLAVASGKDQNIYVIDRDNMGKFSASTNNVYQQIGSQLPGQVFSKPSYFNGTVYYGGQSDRMKAFPISNAKLATAPSSESPTPAGGFPFPGATPTISANGTTNGIVWAVQNSSPAVLHAYDATNLANELYNSNQAAAGRDQFANNKFITPMVVNGRVYVGTPNSVAVFGLLP